MSDFLNTEQGAAWLAITVDEWEQKILRAHSNVRQTSMQGLNGWLQARFRELHATEEGRILTSKLQDIDTSSLAGFQSTTLQLPILVTEEYVRKRLMGLVSRGFRRYFGLFAWRVAVAGILLEAAKAGVRATMRRRRSRLKAVVNFILDTALPTSYFGPALGIWNGVLHLLPRRSTVRNAHARTDHEQPHPLGTPPP